VRTLYFLLKNSIASEMTHMFDLRKQRDSAGSAVVELALLQISYLKETLHYCIHVATW